MKEIKGIIPKRNNDVAISSTTRLKAMWTAFEEKKSKGGTFVHFNDYRYSLGGRGIWGTKIFFRALKELNFIIECDEASSSLSKYCPSEYARDKYEDLFMFDKAEKMWGLSQENLDEFDAKIFPSLIATARKLEIIYAIEKKEKAQAKYSERKAQKKANEKLTLGVSI